METTQAPQYKVVISYELTKGWSRRDIRTLEVPTVFQAPRGNEAMKMVLQDLDVLDSKGLPTAKAKDFLRDKNRITITSIDWFYLDMVLDSRDEKAKDLLKGPDTVEDPVKKKK